MDPEISPTDRQEFRDRPTSEVSGLGEAITISSVPEGEPQRYAKILIPRCPALCTAIGDSLSFLARFPHSYSPALRSSASAARRPGRSLEPYVCEGPVALVAAVPRCVSVVQFGAVTVINWLLVDGWKLNVER
jgi:hypothetical protein